MDRTIVSKQIPAKYKTFLSFAGNLHTEDISVSRTTSNNRCPTPNCVGKSGMLLLPKYGQTHVQGQGRKITSPIKAIIFNTIASDIKTSS